MPLFMAHVQRPGPGLAGSRGTLFGLNTVLREGSFPFYTWDSNL